MDGGQELDEAFALLMEEEQVHEQDDKQTHGPESGRRQDDDSFTGQRQEHEKAGRHHGQRQDHG